MSLVGEKQRPTIPSNPSDQRDLSVPKKEEKVIQKTNPSIPSRFIMK